MREIETGWQFFIKKHRASCLHYDFRLEYNDVLKSWVISDGPCLDPKEPRLAVLVNNHKVEYGSFERVIPFGQYGAGPVQLWDQGIWLPCQDVDQGLRDGHLKFQLLGSKLKGTWLLIRMPDRPGQKHENWQLIKEQDAEARSLSDMDILIERPESVLTGRTLDEIAAEPHLFMSDKSNSQATIRSKKKRSAPNQLFLFPEDPES